MFSNYNEVISSLIKQVNNNIIGQQHVTKAMIIALLTGGHILLEGLPGTAKTRAVKTLADSLKLDFKRIQFTPDLLPSDVTGTQIYHQEKSSFQFQPGPIFSSILLADEINRAPAKVQAALLEAMAENTVTIAGETRKLAEPFIVLATQNPIEQDGTYPLPEAQMDRFMMKVDIGYPSAEAEMDIISLVRNEELQTQAEATASTSAFDINAILHAKEIVKKIHVAKSIDQYIVDLVIATREPQRYPTSLLSNWIDVGVSPRTSIALDKCSRAHALIEGRDYVTPDDVRSVLKAVLGHRITLSFNAISDEISIDDVINELLLIVSLT